jgi:fluoride exporter
VYATLPAGMQMANTEMVLKLLCICFGGGVGALTRFGIGELFRIGTRAPGWVAIMVANFVGCFVIGAAYAGYADEIRAAALHAASNPMDAIAQVDGRMMMALVVTGFCGGLTTFSTFWLDSIVLLHERRHVQAFVNVVFSVVVGTLLVVAGIALLGGLG